MIKVLLLIYFVGPTFADLFASMSEMENLVKTEEILIKDLEKFVLYYEEALEYLKMYVAVSVKI